MRNTLLCTLAILFCLSLPSCFLGRSLGVYSADIDDLSSDDASVRRQAASRFGQHQEDEAIPHLIRRLIGDPRQGIPADPVPIVRAQCATALGQIGKLRKDVKYALRFSLNNDPNTNVQHDVILAIKKLSFDDARPLLEEKLNHSSAKRVKFAAARALLDIGTESSLPVLIKSLKNTNYRVKKASLKALRTITGENGPMKPKWWENWLSSQ